MPNFVHILLRVLAGIAGALLLYVAFFLYEDEETRIQNRLEQIWQKINALQSAAISKEAAFLQGVTGTTSGILDRLLGHELMSDQSVLVSTAFSAASLFVWFNFAVSDVNSTVRGLTLISALSLVVLGSLPGLSGPQLPEIQFGGPIRKKFSRRALSILFVSFVGLSGMGIFGMGKDFKDYLALLVVVTAVPLFAVVLLFPGIFMDVLFVVFFRWVLRKIAKLSSVWLIILYFSAVSLVALLLIGPAFVQVTPSLFDSLIGSDYWHGGIPSPFEHPLRFCMFYASWACMTNIVDVLCLLLVIVILLLLLTHRLLWPLIKRLTYAANRKQLIKNTKLLCALGTMLLMYAFPNNPIVKWVTHFLPNLKGG